MLRVTVELWPGGNDLRRRVIATADIGRIRNGVLADYEVRLSEAPVGEVGVPGLVQGYPRWSGSVWDLVARSIAVALNHGVEELPLRPTLLAVHERSDGVRYVRLDQIPQPARKLFEDNIDGESVPGEGLAYEEDWSDFLKGARKRTR
jgi:hypothetical protein